MPVCPICDAEDFEEVEGLYYCSVCQTQSQSLRVEELDDHDQTHHTTRYSLPSKFTAKSAKVLDFGRPWSTNEGFQFILRGQVDALIQLGAKQGLKDVMFALWKLYLGKLGRAFGAHCSLITAQRRLRDLHLPKQEKAVVQPVRLKRTLAKKASASAVIRRAQAKQDQEGLSSVIGEEEFYEGDNPIDDIRKDLDAAEELESDSGEEDEEGHDKRQVSQMSMPLTLAFCYLAMLHTKHLVSEAAILKWVQAGQLPYNQAANSLPDHCKFSNADFQTFCSQRCPSSRVLRSLTGRLARYLGMESFPSPSVKDLLHLYICQLQLPGEFHGLVSSMLEWFPVRVTAGLPVSGVSVPPYAGLAMAYLIVAIKLLFGLNDVTERQLSSYAREVCRDITTNQMLFIWDDWVWHMTRDMVHRGSSHRPESLIDALASRSPIDCIHGESVEQTQRYSFYRETRHCYQQAIKTALLRPLSALEDLIYEQEASSCTSMDQPSALRDTSSQQRTFPGSTVQYVSQAYEFLAHGGNHGLAEVTIAEAQPAASSHQPLHSSTHSTQPDEGSRKRKLSSPEGGQRAVAAVRHALLQGLRYHTPRDTPLDNRAASLSHHLAQAGSKYALYQSMEKAPSSYRWLLATCSHMIGWQSTSLAHLLYTLELMLLVPAAQRTTAQNNCIRRARPVFTVLPRSSTEN